MSEAPDITIPPEALEAAAREQARRDNVNWDALNDIAKELRLSDAAASCLAMLKHWPGVHEGQERVSSSDFGVLYHEVIILPLPTEASDE